MKLIEEIAARTLPPGSATTWTAMSYQEKIVGKQMYLIFGLGLLLVYLVLAGQYESWFAPVSVILAVPLSLVGPVLVFSAFEIDNNLYVQIGLVLLIALSAKNAILIVDLRASCAARGRRHSGIRHRGGPRAIPADPDDVVCVHPRRVPAGDRERGGRQRARLDRHHGVHRDDRFDVPGGSVRAGVLRACPAVRGVARGAQACAGREPAGGVGRCRERGFGREEPQG